MARRASNDSGVTDRPDHRDALARTAVLARLAAFDPHVAGTPPLGIDLPSSDIDILCHAPDPHAFAETVCRGCAVLSGFAVHQWRGAQRPVVARFTAEGWAFELFGSPEPVAAQPGWRHFLVERRLLAIGGDRLRAAILALRHAGAKTEPAFAQLLGLAGDPYAELLTLEAESDAELARRLETALSGASRSPAPAASARRAPRARPPRR
jgi:hypothetical protein